jgi:N-acetylglucosaminyldiphosphoundecaprenol N-acetyl-beta-D-mannosaminyltransferase
MQIFGIKLDKLKYNEFLNLLKSWLKQDNDFRKIIFTPNPEILLNTLKDREFKEILQKADYLTIDGIWIYIGLQILEFKNIFLRFLLLPYFFFNLFFRRKYLYKKYWERICGSDLTKDLLEYAQKEWIKITILDPYFPQDKKKCKAQETFKKDLEKVFPKLDFDFFIYKPEEKQNIIKQICLSNSKILFSTLWMKTQEKSVIEIMEKCENIKIWLWVGSSFDYFTWFQKRAPKILRSLGLEWLYRLITWPQKIKRIKRLYMAIFVFVYNVLFEK